MNPKLFFKPFQRSLKFLLLVSLFFGISNCKRDIDGPCGMTDKTFDTSFFEKNEKDLLPDWEGDSLFFYSDAGDTAYLFCRYQGIGIAADYGGGGPTWCSWIDTYPYESFGATYSSNNSELDDIGIKIYKESYRDQWNPPLRQALIRVPKVGNYTLFEFDSKTLPNDSVSLANGQIEVGRISGEDVTMNLKVGILKIKRYSNGKKWTLFRYTLNN
jgi:hypothetical protein